MPDARACLGPDDSPLRATVAFDGSGAVARVSVGQGESAACVREHLGAAHVAPFADAPFVATVTVRP
jgi:hypothetical protein